MPKSGPLRSLRRASKNTLVRLLGAISGREELQPIDQIDWTIVRKVLLIRPNFRMGNLLLTTTALPILRANFPNARIDMLCPQNFATLLENHPALDHVHTFTRKHLINPVRLFRLMKRVRLEEYDLVIDGTLTGSAAMLTRWSGGWMRIGTGKEIRHFAFTSVVPEPPRKVWRVEAMRHYFASMGLRVPEDTGMEVHLSASERERARERWERLGFAPETHVTGVFIGARGDKRWPVEKWAEVIRALWEGRGEGEGLVVFHGREEFDLLDRLESLIPREVPISFSPGVRQFAALAAQCRQFVSSDTGPMHLACALGVPVVSLFARKSWARFAPQRPVDQVVLNLEEPEAAEVVEAHRRQRAMLKGPPEVAVNAS